MSFFQFIPSVSWTAIGLDKRPQANLSATGGVPNQIDLIFPSTSGSVSNNGISQASTNLLSTALGSVTIVIS